MKQFVHFENIIIRDPVLERRKWVDRTPLEIPLIRIPLLIKMVLVSGVFRIKLSCYIYTDQKLGQWRR